MCGIVGKVEKKAAPPWWFRPDRRLTRQPMVPVAELPALYGSPATPARKRLYMVSHSVTHTLGIYDGSGRPASELLRAVPLTADGAKRGIGSGRCWNRTSDPRRVKAMLYR